MTRDSPFPVTLVLSFGGLFILPSGMTLLKSLEENASLQLFKQIRQVCSDRVSGDAINPQPKTVTVRQL
jgi:hypothetical protein